MTATPKSNKKTVIGVLVGGGVVVALVLAFGVFGLQTLFFDQTVSEEGPAFTAAAPTTTAATDDGATTTTPPTTAPVVTEVGRGTFTGVGRYAGGGTVVLLSDGTQSFVRFEDDFSTDNGPDLFVRVTTGNGTTELARLKGNKGSQNYELPAGLDSAAVTEVDVWCKRFSSTFTTAPLS
jgi:hypothetical protein